MTKIDKWVLGFAGTFILNFIGFFFFLYDVLGTRFEEVNRLAHEHGSYPGGLFLLMLVLLVALVYNDKKGGRNNHIMYKVLIAIIPIVAFIGHILIVLSAIEVYRFIS